MIDIFLSSLPPLLWFFYFSKKDTHPEPLLWLFLAFVLGIVSAFLSYLAEDFFYTSLYPDQALLYLFSAFVEEFLKFLVIWLFIFPHKVFDEPIDAMMYMMVSALGFASVENFFYLQHSGDGKILILFLRFLGANFLHILASALIGYGYGYFKTTLRIFPLIISFTGAVFLHFIYNFVIISKVLGFIFILPILWSVFLIVLSELEYLVFINERRKQKT